MMIENPLLAEDRQILGDIYTSSEMMDNLAILCDEFGSRFGGTEGEKLAVEFMRQKLEAYGLKQVHLEPIAYLGWIRGDAQLEITHPIRRPISCISLPHSPPADITGSIIDMGDGAPEAFDRRAAEIAGKIVLTNSEVYPNGVKRWIHRNEKYGRSVMAGAIGFIFANHYPGFGPATGGIGRDPSSDSPMNGEAPIPGFSVSLEDGTYMQRLIDRMGEVTIRLESTDRCLPMTSWNLLGDLPASSSSDQIIALGCHYDGHDISQGAGDPASGAVVVLETARVLAKYTGELSHSIRFFLWGVEEIGLIGSKAYIAAHEEELDRIRFYLNLDSAGVIENKGIVFNEWPELEPIFDRWGKEMSSDFGMKQSVNAHSDHFPFLMAGVPTGGLGNVGGKSESGRGYGHTKHDTLDKINLASLREAAALTARLTLRP
jgi:Iap family predicted aminopeptidase